MKKFIRGQGALTKWTASKIASYNKADFTKYISKGNNLNHLYETTKHNEIINIEVVSFSSTFDFSEQILSILSFARHIGTPTCWTVYSDNSHTIEQSFLLNSALPFTKLINKSVDTFFIDNNIKNTLINHKDYFLDYAHKFPLGKKLFYYLNHPIAIPTLFLDSDILFYKKSSCLHNLLRENVSGWFLPDAEWGNLDTRYLKTTFPHQYQVNSGLFLVNKEFSSISKGLHLLESINGRYEYFSEQSILHTILTDNKYYPLDPRVFILNSEDQFDFSYLHNNINIAARHYTGPVRHKMWQRDWKWHLSL